MDDPSTLRRKAARYFENAASASTSKESQKLEEVARQLELWADDLEEVEMRGQKNQAKEEPAKHDKPAL
jgi:hypothetical protein